MLDILRAVGWVGPGHMGVLFDPADETYTLLEVNPRLWMSVALTIRSGVDVPKLLVALADGDSVGEPIMEYDTDLLYRWLLPNGLLWVGQQERRLTGCSIFYACLPNEFATGPSRVRTRWSPSRLGHRASPSFSTKTCNGRFSGVRPPTRRDVREPIDKNGINRTLA